MQNRLKWSNRNIKGFLYQKQGDYLRLYKSLSNLYTILLFISIIVFLRIFI